VVHVTEWRVLVRMIGFISTLVTTSLNHTQSNTIAILHILQSLHTNPPSLFPLVSTVTFSLWINRPNLHHSLTAPNCNTLKVFTSHLKSSQADFFDCELPAAISYRQLPTLNWTDTSYRLSLYRLRTDPSENTAFIIGEACLPSRFLAIEVYSCGAEYIENTSTVSLTACVCWTVYTAVAWQCFDEIRYNIQYTGHKTKEQRTEHND
jgi:hypothetical protein